MSRRRSLPSRVSLGCLALALAGCSGVAAPLGRPVVSGPIRDVLPNGVRVIVEDHRAADVVALQLWVGVGARDESPAERGYSHFAEHMLFKGTERFGRGFVDREVETFGGRTNAGTSYDYTFYYMLLPASRALQGIEVLADMAFRATFEPAELDREREVVFEEFRLGEDNPRMSLVRRLYDLAFEGHAYGHAVLGDMEILRVATRESLRGYYARHYVPENMTVVVVGAVNPHEVRDAVRSAFSTAPAAGYRRVEPELAAPVEGGRDDVVERPERQAFLGLGWTAPPLGHEDMFAVDLLAHVLGGSRSSRLHQALREQARLVSTVGASYGALQRGGLVSVTAQLEAADVEAVEGAVMDEVRRLQEGGISGDELARALAAAEAQHLFSRETAEGLAIAYGRAETLWTLQAERFYLEDLRAVTRDDVRRAARQYLTDAYARLGFVPRGRSR